MSKDVVSVPAGADYFTIDRVLAGPRALIWKCYTQPQHLARFWGPRDAKTAATIDLRVGGVWTVRWTYASGAQYAYASVYLDLVEPERIHYRDAPNDWPGGLDGLPPAELISTIALSDKDGGTNVHVHVKAASIKLRDETVARGFAGMVGLGHDRLEEYLPELLAQGAR
jgi:uncharacterized protein YndB with AHSA1/START domain